MKRTSSPKRNPPRAQRAKGYLDGRLIACAMLRHAGLPMMSPYYAGIFEGILEELAAHDFEMLFTSVPYTSLWTTAQCPRAVPLMPRKNRFRGALLIGGLTDDFAMAYRKQGIRVMLVDKPPAPDLSSVMPDNFDAARQAGRYLVKLGHRRIAFLEAPPDPVVAARFEGFCAALREAGIAFDPKDLIRGGYGTGCAAAAMTDYLKKRKTDLPSAILAINDEAAFGVLRALRARKLTVPKDMSVMGFDDIPPAADSNPPLTTMQIPLGEMGHLAARSLIAQIEGSAAPVRVKLQTKLVIRESCARP